MRVLMSFVGKRDPWAEDNTEGSILTLTRFLKPDYLVLFPTAKGLGMIEDQETETAANMVCSCLKEELGMDDSQFCVHPIVIIDPRDYEKILLFLRNTVPQILETIATPDYEICINLSSGTPQMHSCWLLNAGAGLIPKSKYYMVASPQNSGPSPEDRVREINANFLKIDLLIRGYMTAVKQGLFFNACQHMEDLNMIVTDLRLSILSEKLAVLMTAYNEWDMLDYKKAYPKIQKLAGEFDGKSGLEEVAGLVKRQASVLQKLSTQSKETETGLIDIYHNMYRCYDRGAYADCLSRFYRLYEGVLYYRLRQKKIEPVDLEKSEDKTGLTGVLLSRGVKILSLTMAQELLTDKDPGTDRILKQQTEIRFNGRSRKCTLKSLLESTRKIRNNSVVGHNMRPVSPDDALQALHTGKALLRFFFGSNIISRIDSYPFTINELKPVTEVLRST